MGFARASHGTARAARALRCADGRAELHERLGEHAGRAALEHGLGDLPVNRVVGPLALGLSDREQSRDDPRDVAVDERGGPVEGDRGDRAGGVAPDAGDLSQRVGGPRNHAVVALEHVARPAVEQTSATVVAEPAPGLEH